MSHDPSELAQVAQEILSRTWGGRVRLGAGEELRNATVMRFPVLDAPARANGSTPASIVAKRARLDEKRPYDPDATEPNPAWRLFEDWAGAEFLSSLPGEPKHSPCFFGGDRQAGVIVLEDLGSGESLVEPLLGDDPVRAEQGLVWLAQAVGRLHAATIGRQAEFQRIRDALRHRATPQRGQNRDPDEPLRRLHQGFETIGVKARPGFDAEYEQVAAVIRDPGPFLAYVHSDPCPDNCRIVDGRVRLFDFEASGYQHALVDAVYGRMVFPSCWCVNQLPAHIAPRMEAAYRAELIQGCPAAGDDGRFYRDLACVCAYWLIANRIWMLDTALKDDWGWGISTWRQRVLVRLDALAATTEEFGHLKAMGRTARECALRLRELWPSEADAMPLYPAFRGSSAITAAV